MSSRRLDIAPRTLPPDEQVANLPLLARLHRSQVLHVAAALHGERHPVLEQQSIAGESWDLLPRRQDACPGSAGPRRESNAVHFLGLGDLA